MQQTVGRTGWEVLALVWMPNHFHLLLRTPHPNLSKGMQYLLSGYANWYAKRHRRSGHLFQGRFKGELIEDESYFWNVSRYVHLNPVRGKRPLVEHPADWPWGSYPGYSRRRHQVDYVAYRSIYEAWQGESGGTDPARAYRRFVEAGLSEPPANPFLEAWEGWLLGGDKFLARIKAKISGNEQAQATRPGRYLASADPAAVIRSVAGYFGVDPRKYRKRRSSAAGRDLAAYLAHRRTTATLRELAEAFGLSNPDSVSNLIRRAERSLGKSAKGRRIEKEITESLLKTDNRI